MKAVLTLVATALAAAALAGSASAAERYVPFVTDFPTGVQKPTPTRAAAADGFDRLDAAFGAAAGLALGALAAGSLPAARRRRLSSA